MSNIEVLFLVLFMFALGVLMCWMYYSEGYSDGQKDYIDGKIKYKYKKFKMLTDIDNTEGEDIE